MTVLTSKTNISDTYPNPNNATARTAMANIWDVINEFTGKSELDVASAATIDIGAQSSTKLRITGTTGPVTSLGIVYRGPILVRLGSSGGVFTHNATTLKCPGAVNYTGTAGDVLMFSPIASVSGTPDGWELIVLQGSYPGATFTGAVNMAVGANIASAATINLTTATGNFVHITGTTPVTAVTLGAGMSRTVIFDGILTLTHHATNNSLPGAANITTAAGDRAIYWSDGTTVYCINYIRASGWEDYSATSTIVGWSSFTTKKIWVKRENGIVHVLVYLAGTSDSAATNCTLPYANSSDIAIEAPLGYAEDNGTAVHGGITMATSSSTVTFGQGVTRAGWTGSGTKKIEGQFFYKG